MSALRKPLNEQDHITGNPQAEKVLIEYGDYQCQHCGKAYPYIKRLLKQYKNEFLFVFRNFPLQESHPLAMMAAMAAESAGRQGKFWEMHDLIFEHQEGMTADTILGFAGTLKLDTRQFAYDIRDKELLKRIEDDFVSGLRSGVNGTPTFFLNGERVASYDESYESLERLLKN